MAPISFLFVCVFPTCAAIIRVGRVMNYEQCVECIISEHVLFRTTCIYAFLLLFLLLPLGVFKTLQK